MRVDSAVVPTTHCTPYKSSKVNNIRCVVSKSLFIGNSYSESLIEQHEMKLQRRL
jgi:hypothetical protein